MHQIPRISLIPAVEESQLSQLVGLLVLLQRRIFLRERRQMSLTIREIVALEKRLVALYQEIQRPIDEHIHWLDELNEIAIDPNDADKINVFIVRLTECLELTRIVNVHLEELEETNSKSKEKLTPDEAYLPVIEFLKKNPVQKLVDKILVMYCKLNPTDSFAIEAVSKKSPQAIEQVFKTFDLVPGDQAAVLKLFMTPAQPKESLSESGFFNLQDQDRFLNLRHKFPFKFLNNAVSRAKFWQSKEHFWSDVKEPLPALTIIRSAENYIDNLDELKKLHLAIVAEKDNNRKNKKSLFLRFRRRKIEKDWAALLNLKEKSIAENYLNILEDVSKHASLVKTHHELHRALLDSGLDDIEASLRKIPELAARVDAVTLRISDACGVNEEHASNIRALIDGSAQDYEISYLISYLEDNNLKIEERKQKPQDIFGKNNYEKAKAVLLNKFAALLKAWPEHISEKEQAELKFLKLLIQYGDIDAIALQYDFEKAICTKYYELTCNNITEWQNSGWKKYANTLKIIREDISDPALENKSIKEGLLLTSALNQLIAYVDNDDDGFSFRDYAKFIMKNFSSALIEIMATARKKTESHKDTQSQMMAGFLNKREKQEKRKAQVSSAIQNNANVDAKNKKGNLVRNERGFKKWLLGNTDNHFVGSLNGEKSDPKRTEMPRVS